MKPAKARELHRFADEELMHLVQEGNTTAFEIVYDRHGAAAYSLAYRMVGNRVVAEDIVQEAFLSMWRSRSRFEPQRGSLRSWVLGIVHHRGIDALRRNTVHNRRQAGAEAEEERREAPATTEVEVIRRQEAATVRAALDLLPPEQSRVLELAYFAGFSQSQIAELMKMPIGTVKGRMRLGLAKLRASLGGEMA